MHLYELKTTITFGLFTAMHDRFPSHTIWMAKLSPKGPTCSLDQNGITTWMTTSMPQTVALGYVEKVFWNSGEFGPTDTCNPSLMN